jgi:hypothetical protein
MPGGLQFVLILPDGNKSLVSDDWTDFRTNQSGPQGPQSVGSPDDLLSLRALADALLQRAARLPVISRYIGIYSRLWSCRILSCFAKLS